MSKVEAVIRIRPLSVEEKSRRVAQGWHKIGDRGIIQHLNSLSQEVSAQTLLFDWVFGEDAKNEDIFARISSTVDESMDGSNVCIIAYGQTSSGKTYTMKGTFTEYNLGLRTTFLRSDPGLIPRSIERIFSKKMLHKFTLSYVEVYNENIYDLLGDPLEPLQIRESADGEVYIKDVSEREIRTKEEAYELFRKGNSIRKVSATRMNRESSRSHAVLKISIRAHGAKSSLVFVDLAGSERVSAAQTSGASLKEGAAINKSLLALTSVISKLSKKQSHIPYRDAKLTRILQPSFSRSSKTVLICAISPTPNCIDETISTLALASRARNIEIKPAQRPQIRRPARPADKNIYEIKETVKVAKDMVRDLKTDISQAQSILDEIGRISQSKESFANAETLSQLLLELRKTKDENIERLSELSESVEYLMQQERVISEKITPPPEIALLLEQLAEGDALIQQQKEQLEKIKGTNHIDDANISMAMEMDRLKQLHHREKRMLQLKIAQLKSHIKSQTQENQ